ncbi:histidine phosphatase family protein [Nocardia aurantia]|uniref:2,3-bisphosphoglycerate-dependent phosphoglycerate mutase n=1 Tax=Nocardia aurantia TaxID=2585199 RepID=A0A7K0DIJ8_9NOCA|nr:histidine phosphatase family protein [Nocardia aurantia]MQY24594.1 2,3-bisphosphoglycerate-dependent phosphoglycerate mutase [Nocardia aurantia]
MTDDQAPTRLILVRHGEAHANVDDVAAGVRTCRGLTDRGRQQAERLAKHLASQQEYPIAAVYSSNAARARQTGEILAIALDKPVIPALSAPDYGKGEGRPWPEIITGFGDAPALHPDRPIAPGAEPWTAFQRRTGQDLADLVRRYPGKTVAVVAHRETVIAAAMNFLSLLPWARANITFSVDYTGVTIWQYAALRRTDTRDGYMRWNLLCHNDTRHLD